MRTINKNVFERVLLWAGRSDLLNLLTFANASERYVRRPTDGDLFGPFASGIPAKIPISGHPYLHSLGAVSAFTDLGQQYSQTHILSLSSLGNGIALAGTYPHGKILRSVDYGATWADLGQQYSQTYVYELCYLGNGIALAGTGVDGKILRTTNSSFSQVKDQSYIASALLPNSLRDKCRFSFYTPYSDTQMASGEKCYLARYDDSGANSVGLYLYQTDKKVHLEINGVDSILSGALTWSAGDPQKSVLIDRLAGTLTTAGFTTGNSTETGAVWSQPNGLLRLGMDGSELNHLRGFVRIDAS